MTDENTGVTDQPNEESQDQPAEGREQPKADSSTTLYEVNGEELTVEELKQGYMRQSDYTRKTQALKEQERLIARQGSQSESSDTTVDPDDEAVVNELKKRGFVTKEELQKLELTQKALMEDEKALNKLMQANPHLRQYESAIRKLGKVEPTKAYEDIVVEHGFTSKDKLSKARAALTPGSSNPKEEPKPKSIKDMTPQEYEAWKRENLKGTTLERSGSL